MMLDALGVRLRRIGWHPNRDQQVDDKTVAFAHPFCEGFAADREKHAAIGFRGRKPLAL